METLVRDVSPFPVDRTANTLVHMFEGDVCTLKVHAVVNYTHTHTHTHTYRANKVSRRLIEVGGSDLLEELEGLDSLRCGDVCMSSAPNMNFKKIIHTVGPKFNSKFRNAAHNSLSSLIREIIKTVGEAGLSSLVIPCVYSDRMGFPLEECIHVTIRTLRRWLILMERHLTAVVCVASNEREMYLFKKILALYFPRNSEEENHARYHLPVEIGNAIGESEIPERKIRIRSKRFKHHVERLTHTSTSSDEEQDESIIGPADVSFRNATRGIPSLTRRAEGSNEITPSSTSTSAALASLSASGCVRSLGSTDHSGRKVVVITLALFPSDIGDNAVATYLENYLGYIACDKWAVLFVCSELNASSHGCLMILKDICTAFSSAYSCTLDIILVLHCPPIFKAIFYVCWPVLSSSLWDSTVFVSDVQSLSKYINTHTLNLPSFVHSWELSLQDQSFNSVAQTLMNRFLPQGLL
eukprot:GHVR01042069.1.p1 GENE.GHVR01042069.1~~GHVR01042069.1.p1  ORF type:complete len:527 (-),score=80.64 GHVR01042069.1:321-1724(-)